MVCPIFAAVALGVVSQAVRTPPLQLPHSTYHLDYQPRMAEPDYKLQNRSSNGAGKNLFCPTPRALPTPPTRRRNPLGEPPPLRARPP